MSWPFLNFTSAGIVAAKSTTAWSTNGTRDSRPWAIETRSSICSSAGSSVLKSKWVMESKYDSLRTFVGAEDALEALERRLVAEHAGVDRAGQLRRAVDEAVVAPVEVLEQAVAPELAQQRLVVAQRGQARDDRLVRDDEVAVARGAVDGGLDALLEVGDQIARVAAEDLVAALPAEHDLDVLGRELRDHVLRDRARPGDGEVEVVDHVREDRADVLGRDRDLVQVEGRARPRGRGRSGSRRTPARRRSGR